MDGQTDMTPKYGQRTLLNIIDEYATNDPTRPYWYEMVSSDPKDGFRSIMFKEVSKAIDHLAHELLERDKDVILAPDDFPTVAYIGPNDLRYVIVLFACVKAHRKAFFISPRNSLEAQVSLLQATNCNLILYDQSFHLTVQPVLESHPIRAIIAPDLDVWLQSGPEPLPYNKSFEEARWDPLVVMHTSGSTGIPKPIVVRQGSIAIGDGLRSKVHDSSDFATAWSHWGTTCTKMFVPMPLFHISSILTCAMLGVYYGLTLVVPNRPLTAELVIECLAYSGADTALLPPSVVEDLSRTEEGIESLVHLRLAAFGGGNLAPAVGNALIKRGVRLLNVISSTEALPYILHYQCNQELWQYFIFNSKDMGADFRLVSSDEGTYELHFRRINPDPKEPGLQAVFYTFPEKTEWSTGDLFKPHPTLPDHWMYQGRADSIIVFSTGEKLNPGTIEETVLGHPDIKGALVVGAQRFQPALILEPVVTPKDEAAAKALIDSVWPVVEEVNKVTVAHGRIVQQLVVLSDPAKPFRRTPKGSVRRADTVKVYKDFIDQIYEQHDQGLDVQQTVSLDLANKETLTASIVDAILSKIGNVHVQPDVDLFSIGMDSMQVITLSKLLQSSLETAGVATDEDTVAPRVIYSNSTPRRLAEHLYSIAVSGGSGEDEKTRDIRTLSEMVSKYTADLPEPNTKQSDPLDAGQTVIVTGTTGSLGAYMLDRLISNSRVAKVLAFNRGDDGGSSRQPSFNAARGLTTDFSKVEFLGVDLSQPLFGLSQAKYAEILATADRIIHNAWPVNFNISVDSFEPYIRGVRHLVDFSNQASRRVPIIFISSISTADNWTSSEPVPEQRLADLTLPYMGYGQSKLAGSLILDAASERSGVPTATIRVGQIGGPRAKEGMWNKQEFIPSLIASSVYLGMLPDSMGTFDVVDWVPVEDVAGLVLDLTGIAATVPLSNISGYFHAVNPSKTSWTVISQVLKDYYDGQIKEIVPLKTWQEALEKSASSATVDADKNPGIKLLDTYRGMVKAQETGLRHVYFDMVKTVAHSPTMKGLGPVDRDLMKNWCEQWKY